VKGWLTHANVAARTSDRCQASQHPAMVGHKRSLFKSTDFPPEHPIRRGRRHHPFGPDDFSASLTRCASDCADPRVEVVDRGSATP